jgi:hypothetical protein
MISMALRSVIPETMGHLKFNQFYGPLGDLINLCLCEHVFDDYIMSRTDLNRLINLYMYLSSSNR